MNWLIGILYFVFESMYQKSIKLQLSMLLTALIYICTINQVKYICKLIAGFFTCYFLQQQRLYSESNAR